MSRQRRRPAHRFALSGHIADLNLDTVGTSRRRQGHGVRHRLGARIAVHLHGCGRDDRHAGANGPAGRRCVRQCGVRRSRRAGRAAVRLRRRPTITGRRIQPTRSTMRDWPRSRPSSRRRSIIWRSEPSRCIFQAPCAGGAVAWPGAAATPRRAATGIVPDMTDQGEGVRVGSVQPGSGAENAGLKPGDRLLALGGVKTADLQGLGGCAQGLAAGANGDGRICAREPRRPERHPAARANDSAHCRRAGRTAAVWLSSDSSRRTPSLPQPCSDVPFE